MTPTGRDNYIKTVTDDDASRADVPVISDVHVISDAEVAPSNRATKLLANAARNSCTHRMRRAPNYGDADAALAWTPV